MHTVTNGNGCYKRVSSHSTGCEEDGYNEQLIQCFILAIGSSNHYWAREEEINSFDYRNYKNL